MIKIKLIFTQHLQFICILQVLEQKNTKFDSPYSVHQINVFYSALKKTLECTNSFRLYEVTEI